VAGHDRELRIGKLTIDHMQIGAANAARRNFDQDLAGSRLRNRPLAHDQQRFRPIENHGSHH
jgi:hypothetical protein